MKKRRANGEGSVGQRGDGRWQGRITIGGGRLKPQRRYVYGRTRAEASSKLQRLQAQATAGTLSADPQMTIEQFSTIWLRGKKNTLRPTTLLDYTMVVEKWINPSIGHLRLSKLTVDDVQSFFNFLTERVSVATAYNYARRAKTMLNAAVAQDLMTKNPALIASLPRLIKRSVPVLSPVEMKALMAASSGLYENLLTISLTTALRQSEALGLSWNHVDFSRGEINITQALGKMPGQFHELVELKTPSSRRRIILTPRAVEALRSQRLRQAEMALASKRWDNRLDLVFTNSTGGPISTANLTSRHFKRWLSKAGIPSGMRWHDLRHTAASNLISAGVPITTVSGLLGHSSVQVTNAVYGHAIPAQDGLAAEAMERILAG